MRVGVCFTCAKLVMCEPSRSDTQLLDSNDEKSSEIHPKYLNGPDANHCFVHGVRGKTTNVSNAIPVLIDSNGQLGTCSSSRRYKDNIKNLSPHLAQQVLQLNPVSFTYKQEKSGHSTYGLIAEEVELILPQLVTYKEDGQPETIMYQHLIPLLLHVIKQQDLRLSALEAKMNK